MTPHFIIDMNLPGFKAPATIATRQPSQEERNKYQVALNEWKKIEGAPEENKPEPPQTVIMENMFVTHDIMKTALQMAVKEGTPDALRRLNKIHKAIEDGLAKNGQLVLSKEDHRFLQSKYAKADKWNTNADVCKVVIAVQDAITSAVYVSKENEEQKASEEGSSEK